jgi:hypothetical protein
MSDLLKININERLEKKGNLSYLSWAHAWGEALRIDPNATFHVSTFDRGDGVTQVYMDVNGTALVWVTVTLNGKPMTCQLPVMDNKNKAIPNPDAFAVNTAIMRCMVKALALHGLGLYVYAGEDLPDGEDKPEPKKPEPEQKKEAKPLVSTDWKLNVGKGDDKAWADRVSVATSKLLDQTQTKADVMEVFKINRTVFDQLKLVSKDNYDELMTVFKDMKEKRE